MSQTANSEGIKVKSLYKAIELLCCFDSVHPERGITELAELTGNNKSSVYNILSTFEVGRLVKKNPETGKYSLGSKVLELASVYSAGNSLENVMRKRITELSIATGENVYLAIPEKTKVVYVLSACSNAFGVENLRGRIADMYCTGIGKAMLAFSPEDVIREVVSLPLTRHTPNTICTSAELLKEIGEIREQGYAVDNMEHEYGVKCVGVPIFNASGHLVGGMSITGPSLRFTPAKILEYAQLLMETAASVKYQLV